MTIPKPLGRVISLGRPWNGVGPFIFASRHVDKYPAGAADLSVADKTLLRGRQLGSDMRNPSGWSMYHSDNVPGFPAHPHRGFETISIVRSGFVDHADSTGAGARYGPGDVQWVTAGAGVSHSEMFPLIYSDKPNPLDMYQIWLNLPAARKSVPPEFVMMWDEKVPVVTKESARGTAKVTVVAGQFDSVRPLPPPTGSWAADPDSDIAVWLVDLEPNATVKIPAQNSPDTKRMFYVHGRDTMAGSPKHTGSVRVNIGGAWVGDADGFEQDVQGRITLTNGNAPAHVLILQGKEIGEPVVQHGPFVMNTEEEIQQAFADYQRTQFGGWKWDTHGPVYGKDEPRFAVLSGGTKEYPAGEDAKL